MDIATLVASRSTCFRRQVGALIVKDKRILATGYNGAATNTPHCIDIGECLREKLGVPSGQQHEICHAVHAEQNAIIQAAKFGISVDGAALYCTNRCCFICAKMVVNSGILKVFYNHAYPDPQTEKLFKEAQIIEVCLHKQQG
jgi:dCMP deaminase